jgi:hypothetical protein
MGEIGVSKVVYCRMANVLRSCVTCATPQTHNITAFVGATIAMFGQFGRKQAQLYGITNNCTVHEYRMKHWQIINYNWA